jgi:hypothetical protein
MFTPSDSLKTAVRHRTGNACDVVARVRSWRIPALLLGVHVCLAALLMVWAGSAEASEKARWALDTHSAPTTLPESGEGIVSFGATNISSTSADGREDPIVIKLVLPPALHINSVSGSAGLAAFFGRALPVNCEATSSNEATCTYEGTLPPYNRLEIEAAVTVGGGSGAQEVTAAVQGGFAIDSELASDLHFGPTTQGFGIRSFFVASEEADGTADTEAGSHPFQFRTGISFNEVLEAGGLRRPAALLHTVRNVLPAGLVGEAARTPRCSEGDFARHVNFANLCPPETAVGVATTTVNEPLGHAPFPPNPFTIVVPVFNLEPRPGEPARFGLSALGVPVILDVHVRNGSDYGVTVTSEGVSQALGVLGTEFTLWGSPSDPRHDAVRGWPCIDEGLFLLIAPALTGHCQPPEPRSLAAMVTLPTTCGGTLVSKIEVDSWREPGDFAAQEAVFPGESSPLPLNGCNQLAFAPSFQVQPDSAVGSTPTGLVVSLHVPQPNGILGNTTSTLRGTTIEMPEGLTVDPSAANGLQACSNAQVGFLGFASGAAQFTDASVSCPDGSKVGVIEEIKTPLLDRPLKGSVYLATPHENPFGSLVALYLVAEDEELGVRVKLASRVSLDPRTGRLRASVENTPQVPFEDLRMHFFDGPNAALSTPADCGTYTANGEFEPWSATGNVLGQASFAVNSRIDGRSCGSALPFAPAFSAGSTSLQAGGFTPLVTNIARQDGEQTLSGVTVHLPPGLLGVLASVTRCTEPQAALATCGPASVVGTTTVSAGVGSSPYTITGGRVFLTGPYKGAPFGISIAEPAKAGPFDLGTGPCDCVVVRGAIRVDPHTAAITVETDPLPTMLEGIPLQVKRVTVTVDRSGFTFNPTNCSKMSITASFTGLQGASSLASSPFEVANCAKLAFSPQFSVQSRARVTKLNGAFLHVKVRAVRGQANIAGVVVQLPVQLPSRLTTLQKACLAATFLANPAKCPVGSNVGTAKAVTPLLVNPLAGPAYLVSYGSKEFPHLDIVLQGEGVTLVLDGLTHIKKGITSSLFRTVPDAPITSFDLDLPQGPYSALAAFGSLCAKPLKMPTTITGQNGLVITKTTRVAVAGCHRHKAHHKKAKKHARRSRKRHG